MTLYLRATAKSELVALDAGTYEGLAFGAEFCARRLPTRAEVREAVALCAGRGLGFSLVTPLLRQAAFAGAARWLSGLAAACGPLECVFNDWGLLHWARAERLPLRPVAGRLLGHQRRDPRVLALQARARSPEEADARRGSLWDDPRSVAFAVSLGVERLELDWLPQGIRAPALTPSLGLSLCAPWLPVTWTPACPWTEEPVGCPACCAGETPVVLWNAEDPHPLWSRGNTLFAGNHRRPSPEQRGAVGADRLVWSEEIPG